MLFEILLLGSIFIRRDLDREDRNKYIFDIVVID